MTTPKIAVTASAPAPGQPAKSSSGLRAWMQQYPLFSYFFMAYAFSWIISVPIVLAERGILPEPFFIPLFAMKPFVGPFLAAFLMTHLTEGREGVLRLRGRIVQWRAAWYWYAAILLGIPALFLSGLFVLPGALASFAGLPPHFLITYLVNFILIFLLGGALGEEPGWRGFALPRLQKRYGPLWGSLVLGIVWTFWHLPDFLTTAQGGGPGTGWAELFTNLPKFILLVMALTFVMTWVYNHTRGSLFIAILLHASINTTGILPPLFPVENMSTHTLGDTAMIIALVVPALLILAITRGRLGYKAQREG